MEGSVIVIPARWASSRFPGKPLAELKGKTLLHRVIATARAAAAIRDGLEIVVATDDERIVRHAAEAGCAAVMTDPAITSGTGRALAACAERQLGRRAIVNLQGDTPFVSPLTIARLLDSISSGCSVATPVIQLDWASLDALRTQKETSPFSGTTCVRKPNGDALWFSKQILPAIRDEAKLRNHGPLSPVFRHVGLYAYTRCALESFERTPCSPYEQLEGLEQLRFLALDIAVRTIVVEPPRIAMSGIDTPSDLTRAALLIDRFGDPHRP